jgi:enhancing lycopene biosynthesis protein 2
MPKVGVVLSGCGVYDGTEIHEAVITLLALDRAGAEIICVAPDAPQAHVVDHLKGAPVEGEARNILTEAARLARGEIRDLAGVRAEDLDAAVFPGGFGAAKNLSSFAFAGQECAVREDVARFIRGLHSAGKPMGFMCIASVLAAKVLGNKVQVTIGNDPATARAIEAMGARHVDCPVDLCVVDDRHKIVSTPAYMLAGSIKEAAAGIERLVKTLVKLAG